MRPRRNSTWIRAAALLLMGACAPSAPRPLAGPATVASSPPAAPTAAASLPANSPVADEAASPDPFTPLEASEPFADLPLPQGHPAVVSLPLGSTTPRPLLVATHGAGGTPSSHCRLWRSIVGDRGFVLCPAGSRIYPYGPDDEARYFYNGHPALGLEIQLALAALIERYGSRVDPVDPLFAGYSQGASMGAMVLPSHPAHFARAALVEGGFGQFEEWNIAAARRFHEQGGERVLLACGRVRCLEHARKTVSYMKQGGLEARLVHAPGAGHSYGETMQRELRAAFPWLVEDDPRWR